jgi:hypothetical protein
VCYESGLPQPHLYFVESGDRLYVGYANASIPTGIVYPGPNVGPQSPERRRRWRRFVLRFRLLADNPRCLQRRSISLSGRTIFPLELNLGLEYNPQQASDEAAVGMGINRIIVTDGVVSLAKHHWED